MCYVARGRAFVSGMRTDVAQMKHPLVFLKQYGGGAFEAKVHALPGVV